MTGVQTCALPIYYYHEIAQALRGTAEILITGPANAKQELVKHLQEHDKAVAACVSAVQTLDHPSDGQLLAHARKHFRAADRMLPVTRAPRVRQPARAVCRSRSSRPEASGTPRRESGRLEHGS